MKLEYLGDAFDHWKGSVIRELSKGKGALLNKLWIAPMFTDEKDWKKNDVNKYAGLLNVSAKRIFLDTTFKKRKIYFRELKRKRSDLFLDPDAGISFERSKKTHVNMAEISQLLDGNSKRVVMVYQHHRGKYPDADEWLNEISSNSEIKAIAYKAGLVTMFFISNNRSRLVSIAKRLEDRWQGSLHRRDNKRILRSWVV